MAEVNANGNGAPASPLVPIEATISVSFYEEEEEDEDNSNGITKVADKIYDEGTRVIIYGLLGEQEKFNNLAGSIAEEVAIPGSKSGGYNVNLDGIGVSPVMREHLKKEHAVNISFTDQGAQVTPGKPMMFDMMCKKEESLTNVMAAMTKMLQNGINAIGFKALVELKAIKYDGQPLAANGPFKWVSDNSKLEVVGNFNTAPPLPATPAKGGGAGNAQSGCCVVQ